jgi:ABC-2 type transport system ATP-binding protein
MNGDHRDDPLLVLERARVLAGGTVGEALTARGGAERVTLAGSVRSLFRLLARDATLASGEAQISGTPMTDAVALGVAGVALLDPPFPAEWTPERYLLESARLAGFPERDARREVEGAIARFELGDAARRLFRDTFVSVKRIVLLAHATIGSPRVLCAEAPLVGLDPSSRASVEVALERAASGRCLVASVTSTESPAERPLIERADWVIVVQGGHVVREGTPSFALMPSSRYAATVTAAGDAFLAALAERGVRATPADLAPTLLGFVPRNAAEVRRVLVELHEGASPDDIVGAAHAVGAPLVELRTI